MVCIAVCPSRSGAEQATPKKSHWAYVAPRRPALPSVKNYLWPRNAIDSFILARLEKEGFTPSPEADRSRLVRRVYLDLIGLPPTVEQVDAFLADTRPHAYERVVDELLASPHYGERWARPWLDLARYADSNGFQRDGFRTVWPYRDWVVRAFNRDLPFDQFTLAQIAGDLLPGATLDDKIATGFNRCTTVNVEGGVDREETRVNAVFDRVNTTATVWLGTTMSCAQCHNHKYDPFSQEEYYRLFAYFNNTADETTGKEGVREFIGPKLEMPLPPEKVAERQRLVAERHMVVNSLGRLVALAAHSQADWERQQQADAKRLKQLPAEVRKILSMTPAKRTKKQKEDLAEYYTNLDPEIKNLREEKAALDKQLAPLEPDSTLVMSELARPRPTHFFRGGNFLDKGKPVTPGVPTVLHSLPNNAPPNRLALAGWLVDPKNPLVARVAVNRWWAEFFGHGLVATAEDFGTQGERPTHPELLDWLATEFVDKGWSMKSIHRLIVTSAAYRQSSKLTPELLRRDPENRLYARGPRVRLDAETIRDNALAVSGLLCRKLGGPPVRPPQPAGIWNVTGVVDNTYRTSQGEDRYRRGLYTFWRRSSPYPSFVAFDAPDRGSCVVQRSRTNTPLQALTLMNDPVYVEAAAALAGRIMSEQPGRTVRERIAHGFRLCLARQPSERELDLLEQAYCKALERYRADPAGAGAVLSPRVRNADLAEMAAWFQIATVLLNLDETITKG
jgi:hypothetical protein